MMSLSQSLPDTEQWALQTFSSGRGNFPMTAVLEMTMAKTDKPICLNPKINGSQPSCADRLYHADGISVAICSGYFPSYLACAMRGRYVSGKTHQRLEVCNDVANALTTVQKDSMIMTRNIAYKVMPNGNIIAYNPDTEDKQGISELQITDTNNVSPTITSANHTKMKEFDIKKFRIRKLTPRECYRLMDIDDNDIDKMLATDISKSQHYKLAGNSIVVNVLYHIFRTMFVERDSNSDRQLTLFL